MKTPYPISIIEAKELKEQSPDNEHNKEQSRFTKQK